MLTNDTLPLAVPEAVGAKSTLKLVVWPGDSVRGSTKPLTENPDPVMLACEIVALPVPVLLTATASVLLAPTLTLPKLRLVGLAFSCPDAETAVADRGTVAGELDAVPLIATWPLAVPAAAGAKLTDKETLCPGAKLTGTGRPLMLNPAPVRLS